MKKLPLRICPSINGVFIGWIVKPNTYCKSKSIVECLPTQWQLAHAHPPLFSKAKNKNERMWQRQILLLSWSDQTLPFFDICGLFPHFFLLLSLFCYVFQMWKPTHSNPLVHYLSPSLSDSALLFSYIMFLYLAQCSLSLSLSLSRSNPFNSFQTLPS